LAEAMGRAHLHAQTHPRAEGHSGAGPAAFTIALSREVGAEGGAIARAVGARLGWPVYDRELLQQIAEKTGHAERHLHGVDEKRASWLRECVEAFAAVPGVSSGAYLRRLVETLVSLAGQGACVIVGRGAAQILPPATTLRVRLVAPRETRITTMSHRLGLTRQEVEPQVDAMERERLAFVKDYFHKDAADPHNYDVVLNTARFSIPECAEVIVEALHRLQAHAHPKKAEQMATA
jgi:hypothetical protein